jgi:XTP/dITP diphosphohydrolase
MSLPLLVVATRNAHKTDEIRTMLQGLYEVQDLSAFPEAPPVDETGTTFMENATLKAVSASSCIPGIVLADDSGIEVDILNGRPGVWSSSFGGVEGDHVLNNKKMISELQAHGVDAQQGTPARFRCVMLLAQNGKVIAEFSGSIEGRVVPELRGQCGFGYDPLFIPEGYDLSFGELSQEVKNSLSHRARALSQVVAFLAQSAQ